MDNGKLASRKFIFAIYAVTWAGILAWTGYLEPWQYMATVGTFGAGYGFVNLKDKITKRPL